MKRIWEGLNPKNRRLAVVAVTFLVFCFVIAVMPSGEKSERAGKREEPVRAILTDRDNGDIRFETLVAQLQNLRDENKELNAKLERTNRDMERMEAGELGPRVARQLEALEAKLNELSTELPDGSSRSGRDAEIVVGDAPSIEDAPLDETGAPIINEPTSSAAGQSGVQSSTSATQPLRMWDVPPPPPAAPVVATNGRGEPEEGVAVPAQSAIRVIGAVETEEEVAEAEEQDNGIYLPSGSILTGTLITGLDAPTGSGARNEPYPALLRIKHEAILPNRFRADVRECFVIVGGYGDLSSERAYLRGESISCIRNDGKVVESALNSYTVGEDGKAGLRGRLVSKQGQMLQKSLTAGVLQGFASAFGKTPVPTLSLDATDTPLYQQAFSADALQSGAVTGVGSAFDRLAQFYIDQAEGMFPVIEIDAGREVEIVMISGGKLAIK